MPETKAIDLFQIRSRFLRSVHLERDFHDSSALDGYVVTQQIKSSLNRIVSGLATGSGQRAWRITGDYGSGKSAFALALARLLSGRVEFLPKQLKDAVDFSEIDIQSSRLIPVLVTSSREPAVTSILRSLKHAISDDWECAKQRHFLKRIQSLIKLSTYSSVPDTEVIQLIEDINCHIYETGKGTGLLIVLDELGKLLEFAALHSDHQDIYLLQCLAEIASRSGEIPLVVIGLLHQGFNTYASQLSQVSQREWDKIAGRYQEIFFNQPLEQTATIVAEALNTRLDLLPEAIINSARSEMNSIVELGWYGVRDTKESLMAIAARLYPLHPTVLPVLTRLFSRFGQNERSLFSFLVSDEPFGLMSFADQPVRSDQYYRIHNLYDYTLANLGHRLNLQSYRSHWSQIESVIESFPAESEMELHILKTTAMLNLLDVNNLLASDETLELSVDGNHGYGRNHVREIIAKLRNVKRVLYDRGVAGGYCLWPYTSVNLERAYNEAVKALDPIQRVSSLLQTELETRPVVARRHYIETGNLRHFEVCYAAASELKSFLEVDPGSADGRILVLLTETDEERSYVIELAKSDTFEQLTNLLIAIPKRLSALGELMQECRRWEWIAQNVPELNHDTYASEEVSRQINASRQNLQKRIQNFIGLRHFTKHMELQWFYRGKILAINSARELMAFLSDICDEIYNNAPNIKNELVNRRTISSAAAGARIRLIGRMFKQSSEPFLGMDSTKKPPEMSMYLSVLQKSGLHQNIEDGFRFAEPDECNDFCRLRPVLRRILQLLESKADARIRISDIFGELRNPPYGVRDGLHPLLIAAFTLIHEKDVAFYEDGAFLRHVSGEHFYRMIKAPETFEIQLCQVSGIRNLLYKKLLSILGLNPRENQESNILDVVVPLISFAAQLPAYTHNTKRLSANALAVRNALRSAKEPILLVFRDLPKACGIEVFNPDESPNLGKVQQFVGVLKDALEELRAAYPELLHLMFTAILKGFDLPGAFSEGRRSLSNTATKLLVAVQEPRLKAFCLRLADVNLSDTQWLESLGSFVCSKPPSKWTDQDIDLFLEELHRLTQQFKNTESIVFCNTGDELRTAVRVAVTRHDGSEVAQVVFIEPEEEALAAKIETVITDLIRNNKRIGLTATSRAIWKQLSQSNNKSKSGDGSG